MCVQWDKSSSMTEVLVEFWGQTEERYLNRFVLEMGLRENLQEMMLRIDFFLLIYHYKKF